jgi:glutamine amidotransferase
MPFNLAIIDYELGNVRSVANAFEFLGTRVSLTRDVRALMKADCLLLPGVGAFGDGMANLNRLGLVDTLNGLVLEEKKPILGICLGMQLFATMGHENNSQAGLGWLDAEVVRFPSGLSHEEQPLKVPHVGWNDVTTVRNNPLLGSLGHEQSFYFVHSYYMRLKNPADAIGVCDYGMPFTAAAQKDNIFAAQFHPEKSLKNGLKLLSNYVAAAKTLAEEGVLQNA